MPEIGPRVSGDGKRGVAEWPKLPRPSSTLPLIGPITDIAKSTRMTPNTTLGF